MIGLIFWTMILGMLWLFVTVELIIIFAPIAFVMWFFWFMFNTLGKDKK